MLVYQRVDHFFAGGHCHFILKCRKTFLRGMHHMFETYTGFCTEMCEICQLSTVRLRLLQVFQSAFLDVIQMAILLQIQQ